MKVLIISAFYPYRGGIAQFSADLFNRLKKDHEVVPVTFSRQYPAFLFPGKSQYVLENDPSVDVIPAKRWIDTINPLNWNRAAQKIKKEEPDLIITRYWMTFFAPSIGYILGKQKKATRIAILDNVIPHERRFFDKPANRYFLKRNDAFVVMSDAVLNDLLEIRPDARYLRIDHPIYDHFGDTLSKEVAREKLGLDPGTKYLLFFGFIRKYKGLDILLEALPAIDPDIQLIIAGETYGSFAEYQEIIDRNKLSSRVKLFNRYISDEEVPYFFSAADACVLPYRSATQSGITSITLNFALPVIATNVGGLPEIVINNETGLICDPDPEDLAQAVNRYFREDMEETMRRNIRTSREKYGWDQFVEHFMQFAASVRR